MFKYDTLIDEEDICNYEDEIKRLHNYVKDNEKVILFGPRRYGKTSILMNVVGKKILSKSKKNLFCYINLQEVKDLESIAIRFSHSIEEAINKVFSVKKMFADGLNIIKSLRPQVQVDPLSGEATITITAQGGQLPSLNEIFNTIINLSKENPLFLVMDEFQDVAFVDEAEALLREFLQKLNKSPVIISGSKKHLLKDIFLDERRPFYGWGKRIELKQIPLEKWKPYILTRMEKKKIHIEDDVLKLILESAFYIPNYICKLCSEIYNSFESKTLMIADIQKILHQIYLDTQSHYAEKISFLTEKQLKFLVIIAKRCHIEGIASQSIMAQSGISSRGLMQIHNVLMDKGYIERDDEGLRIADPFFAHYLSLAF